MSDEPHNSDSLERESSDKSGLAHQQPPAELFEYPDFRQGHPSSDIEPTIEQPAPVVPPPLYDGLTGQPLTARPEPVAETWQEPDIADKRQEEEGWGSDPKPFEPAFVPLAYTPQSAEDTVRQSGLAYSAGIAFFGSVAFTLFLGWIVDQLLGSSPWGIVGGIIMGSVIGFMQFFRITSRIFPAKDTGPAVSPLSEAEKHADD